MTTWLTPFDLASLTESSRPCRQPSRSTPGIDEMGLFFSPSCTKTGRIRLAGDMCVSENACLIVGLRLFLLGRDGRFCAKMGRQFRIQCVTNRTVPLVMHCGVYIRDRHLPESLLRVFHGAHQPESRNRQAQTCHSQPQVSRHMQ